MNIEPDTIWKKTNDVHIPDSISDKIPANDVQPDDVPVSNKVTNKDVLRGEMIPISFSRLNEFDLTVMSERRAGEIDYESKYSVVPLSDDRFRLSERDIKIYLKKKLSNCPGFVKIYVTRGQNDMNRIILVKERNNNKKIVYSGVFKFEM